MAKGNDSRPVSRNPGPGNLAVGPDGRFLGSARPSPRNILATLWALLEGRRTTLIWLGLLVITETVLVLGGTWILKHWADLQGRHGLVLTGSLIAAGLAAGLAVITATTTWLGTRVGEQVTSAARRSLLRRLLALPQTTLDRTETASVLSRLNQDLPWTSQAVLQIYRSLLADTPVVLLLTGYLMSLSWLLTLIIMAFAPAIFLWSSWTAKRLSSLATDYSDKLARRSGLQQDILSRSALLKSSGATEALLSRYHEIEDQVLALSLRLTKRTAITDPGSMVLAGAALVTVALVGANRVERGLLSQGTYLAFLAGLGILVVLTRRLAGRMAGTGRAFGSLARVVALYQILPEPPAPQGDLQVDDPTLRFENVSFRYGTGRPILDSLSMEVPAGRMTVVEGPSGVGKSTLLKLAAGLYRPSQGRVLLGEVDLAETCDQQRSEWIAWLGQEAFLLDDSIEFNLTMGRDLPRSRLVEALERVGLEDLVSRMDASVEDRVGEDGRRLSSGQRRRLALARCLLSPARVLLLDEPTESLDDATAQQIIALLVQEAEAGRTILVATHDARVSGRGDQVFSLAGTSA